MILLAFSGLAGEVAFPGEDRGSNDNLLLANCQNNDFLKKEIDKSGAPSTQTGQLSKELLFKERN